ncbi:putative Fe-S cluster protein YjdI [Paenibacillus sp. V4I3]|uniref:(4Fe-4S)-binding protein n=1 Tax=unclassified Paenibacillus TaxID=185978 RepID=UPI0006473233|nr:MULTISPECIES: (4Fe-4S)-binding protein [unclassified Paenibacillus]MDQ0877617.1 putative Fe-S cluster protein YjdI [Paenibacillus sp. V4I3]MDQ0886510.1 putative Fe-S cluster protein YjdI [Paenibacillus sp. V4I9]
MNEEFKIYKGKDIDVIFHSGRCLHSANCVRGLPGVFNVNKKPWIHADEETADKIADLIDKCPSGALQYIRKGNNND